MSSPHVVSKPDKLVDSEPEEWRDVVGYEGYYRVSSHGRLFSVRRGIIMKTNPGNLGYPQATLAVKASEKQVLVHSLVARAFIGEPNGLMVRHLDDVKTNNHLSNLAYGTGSDNSFDALKNGVHPTGSKTHCPQGHPYSGENLYIRPGANDRRCRACTRLPKGVRKGNGNRYKAAETS